MYREIEKLIEKYFEGNTSLKEEQELKRFFGEEKVPAHLQKYFPYFTFLKREQAVVTDDAKAPFEVPRNNAGKYRLLRTWGVAAGFLVLIASAVFLDMRRSTPDDKEVLKAYQQTRIALSYAGFWLNKGVEDTRTLKYLPESMEDVSKVSYYNKSAKDMQKLGSFGIGINDMTRVSKFTNYQPTNN